MKRIVIPSVIVLLVAVAALSLGTFTGDSQGALVSDSSKECSRTTVMASGNECGDQARATMASEKRACGDQTRATMASERKACGEKSATATKASKTIECPHSGAVMQTGAEEKTCTEKSTTVHASAEDVDKEDACCDKHAMALVD